MCWPVYISPLTGVTSRQNMPDGRGGQGCGSVDRTPSVISALPCFHLPISLNRALSSAESRENKMSDYAFIMSVSRTHRLAGDWSTIVNKPRGRVVFENDGRALRGCAERTESGSNSRGFVYFHFSLGGAVCEKRFISE